MKRGRNILSLLVALLLLAAVAPVFYIEALCRQPIQGYAPGMGFGSVLPPTERRREAASWLSYPQWHVVHSSDSLGRHLAKAPPSSYPYWQDVRSFWSSYCLVNRMTADMRGAGDYKLGAYGLGLRYSAGMLAKGLYENSLGRIFEWIGGWRSQDDFYAARIQQRYAAFTRQTPWYRFPFGSAFDGLWKTNSSPSSFLPELGSGIEASSRPPDANFELLGAIRKPRWTAEGGGGAGEGDRIAVEGPSSPAVAEKDGGGVGAFLRHWERRLVLSGEYGVRGGSAKLIDAATGALGAGGGRRSLRLVARASPGQLAAADPRLLVVRSVEGVGTVAAAPHDAAFTPIAERLAARGIALVEIAGNNDVFVTLLMPRPLDSAEGVVLMTQPLPDRPETLRVGVSTKVNRLHALIRDAKGAGGSLEHVYDY